MIPVWTQTELLPPALTLTVTYKPLSTVHREITPCVEKQQQPHAVLNHWFSSSEQRKRARVQIHTAGYTKYYHLRSSPSLSPPSVPPYPLPMTTAPFTQMTNATGSDVMMNRHGMDRAPEIILWGHLGNHGNYYPIPCSSIFTLYLHTGTHTVCVPMCVCVCVCVCVVCDMFSFKLCNMYWSLTQIQCVYCVMDKRYSDWGNCVFLSKVVYCQLQQVAECAFLTHYRLCIFQYQNHPIVSVETPHLSLVSLSD